MKNVLVVAPHPDDETLGCGGTLLKLHAQGLNIHWLIVTGMSEDAGYTKTQVEQRNREIDLVATKYKFSQIIQLNFVPAKLDVISKSELFGAISSEVQKIQPEMVFCPYRNDAHSDHEVVFDAVMSATKSFRCHSVKKVLVYETLSETDFGMKPEDGGFRPNVYFDISEQLESKLAIMECFESELKPFPFPRSIKAITSLAYLRGVQCNSSAAEAFMLIKEVL